MSKKTKVLVIGGGFGGVKAALELADDSEHFDVTLLTPHTRFEYHGAMYRSATGRSPLEVVVPMREIFSGAKNVTVELDSMIELMPENKLVVGESGREYEYDVLIMAVGYVVNYFGIEGMAIHAESMYSISEAIKLRHRLVGAFRANAGKKPVHITVIGAGPTGVEIVSDIKNFAKIVEGRHALDNIEVQPRLVEAADRVLPTLSQESSIHALRRLRELGVQVDLQTRVTKCSDDAIETDKGTKLSDVTIWTAGNKANPLFAAYPDTFSLAKSGRVAVNKYLQSDDPSIYVVGDAADTEYSGMAQTAIHNAIAVAANLKRVARNQRQQAYKPKKPAYVVPIGGEWALLETDDGVVTGSEGWKARRDADRWVLDNFLVYELANKHYQEGERLARI